MKTQPYLPKESIKLLRNIMAFGQLMKMMLPKWRNSLKLPVKKKSFMMTSPQKSSKIDLIFFNVW